MIGPPGGSVCRIRSSGFFVDDLHILIGPSGVSPLLSSVEIVIRRCSRDSPSDSHIGLYLADLVDQYITRYSNITVHYDRSIVAISWYEGY